MADDVEAKVVTAPAAAATAPAATVTDYALLAASAPVMAVAVLTTPHSHVQRARALWLVLAASRPEARLHMILLGDLATFAHSGRSTNPGFQQLADDPEPGFFAWTNSGREVLASPRLFDFADGVEGVRAAFVNALVLRLLAHEAEHVRQFRDTGSPPTSYRRTTGDFEVKAYSATRDQIAEATSLGQGRGGAPRGLERRAGRHDCGRCQGPGRQDRSGGAWGVHGAQPAATGCRASAPDAVRPHTLTHRELVSDAVAARRAAPTAAAGAHTLGRSGHPGASRPRGGRS